MSRKTIRILLYCVLFSTIVLTDAYGLSQHGQTKAGRNANQASTEEIAVKQGSSALMKEKIINSSSALQARTPKMVTSSKTLLPDEKLALEIKELRRMQAQLIKEKTKDPNNAKKQQLLKQIEKQINIRQMQQQHIKTPTQHVIGQGQPETNIRKEPHFINPRQHLNTSSVNPYQTHIATQNLGHGIVPGNIQQKQNRLYANTNDNSMHTMQAQRHRNVLQQPVHQQNHVVSPNHNLLPHASKHALYPHHTKQREQFIVNNRHLNHEVPQTHILVPVSVLSSPNVLSGQGLHSNKIVFVKSGRGKHAVPVISQEVNSKALKHTPKPLPTTKKTTTISRTTKVPPTTKPTPTSTRLPETTTPMDIEAMKQNFLKRSMRKQDLEIRKLQLEIRALQREERASLPEEENEDGPQQGRGKYGRRRQMYPLIR